MKSTHTLQNSVPLTLCFGGTKESGLIAGLILGLTRAALENAINKNNAKITAAI